MFAGLLVCALAGAAGTGNHLRDFKLGEQISGPTAATNALDGKAVLIDCWGVNCGPCLAFLPEVEKISKRSPEKLVVIGVECQNSSKDKIGEIIKKDRLTYTMTTGFKACPVQFSGIPYAMIFDAKGEMIFNGSPEGKDFERLLHKAVESVTATPSTGAPADSFSSLKKLGS